MNRKILVAGKKLLPLIGITILFYLLLRIGIEKIFYSVITADPAYLLLSLLFFVPIITLQTYKWNFILHKQEIKLDFVYLLRVYLIGWFYGVLTPGKVGSLIRISYLKEKTKKSFGECSSSVILDRILDMLALFILALIGSILLAKYFSNLFSVIFLAFIVIVCSFFFFMDKNRSERILGIIYTFLVPNKLKEGASQSFHSFYDNLPTISDISFPFSLGIFNWILIYSQSYVIARAFYVDVPYIYFITMAAIATIVGLIPITISGLGTREAALITLLAIFEVAPEKVIAFSLTGYVLASVFPAVIGSIFTMKHDLIDK